MYISTLGSMQIMYLIVGIFTGETYPPISPLYHSRLVDSISRDERDVP